MRIGNLVLAAAASLSLFAGATYQGTHKATSLPQKLFAEAKPADFLGDKKCAECHEEKVNEFHKSGHATFMQNAKLPVDRQGCEACHGPGAVHTRDDNPQVIAYAKISPREVSDACLRCHGDLMKSSHWSGTAHARANVSCVSCHAIHPKDESATAAGDRGLVKKAIFPSAKPSGKLLKADQATLCSECHKAEVAKFRQSSHHPVPEGRMVCTDCHTLHPSTASKQLVGVTKEKCVTCHAEIAGPFAFEHDPVAGWTGNGCEECHKAHGSQNPRLMKSYSRGLCSQCHTEKGGSHYPGRSCWNAGCHVAIHGSNTDHRFLQR